QLCPLCGREPNIVLQPAPAPAPAAAPAQGAGDASVASTISVPKDKPSVGGWLLLFCVSQVLLRPLLVLVEVMSQPNPETLEMALDLSLAVLGIVLGIFLWNVRPVAFTLLWIYFGVHVLFAVLGIIGFAVSDARQNQDLSISIRTLLYTLLWFLYFKNSKR